LVIKIFLELAIPEIKTMNKNFSTAHLEQCYLALGLTSKASLNEIKQAYRDLSQIWHPDRYAHNPRLQKKAAAQFQSINSAYSTLFHHLAPEKTSTESVKIQLAEEQSLVEREIKQQSQVAFKQNLQKSIVLGTFLIIPTVFVCSLFLFAPELRKLVQLQGLQNQVKELQNRQKGVKEESIESKQKISLIEQENQALKSKNKEIENKFYRANQTSKQMQQRIEKLESSSENSLPDSINRQTSKKHIWLRDDFKKMVMGKTEQGVIATIGNPDSTHEFQLLDDILASWEYSEQVKDPASGKIGGAYVHFRNGKVDSVGF
jgi:DnaJ domain